MTAEYDVFISHSQKDRPVAQRVLRLLEQEKIRCWIAPRNVPAGMTWSKAIPDAITKSRIMVVILTSGANTSDHVSREVELALKREVDVIPLRVEEVEPAGSLEYWIGQLQWLDAVAPPLEDHIGVLIEKVWGLLQADGAHPAASRSERPTPRATKSSRRGPLIGILVGAVVILAAIVIWSLGWFGGHSGDSRPAAGEIASPEDHATQQAQASTDLAGESAFDEQREFPAWELHQQATEAWLNGDHKQAFHLGLQAAEQGNPASQKFVGDLYGNGWGVSKDSEEALRWYWASVEQGYADAQAFLGFLHLFGIGVDVDHLTAADLNTRAARQGQPGAQAWLGFQYYFGIGVSKDWEVAHRWFESAAKKGESYGQFWMGYMYHKGQVVDQDYDQAARWARMSAEQLCREGLWLMGDLYYGGHGVEKSITKAAEYYQKSADAGYSGGQRDLGGLYERGEGVEKDLEQAIHWYELAAAQNDQGAKDALARLSSSR